MAEYSLGRSEGEIALKYTGGDAVGKAQQDVDNLGKKSTGASKALGAAGTIMMGAGVAIAGGLALAVNSAANFEQRMSAVGAVSGATGKEMESLRSKALQLGKDTQYSATEAASAMEELVKAGVSVPDVLNGAADATVALAAAGEVSLPRAAEVAANAMGAFNLQAKEMPKIADLYAGAANASAISVDELAQSMTAVGAVAHTVGLGIADTTTAIGLLGNAGIKGSDAGTSLKTMLMNLQPQTDKQIALFKKLGIVTKDGSNEFFDAKGNIKSLADISGTLSKSLEGMTKQQKLAALETMFGSDAIRAASVLADQGSKGVDKFATSMSKVTAADVAAKRMDNFKGSIEQLKGSVETFAIQLGSILLPALRQIVDGFTSMLNVFLGLPSGAQTAIVAFAGIAAAVLLIVGAIVKYMAMTAKLNLLLEGTRLQFIATWAAALGPIALIIVAIVAVGIALAILWAKSETFRAIVTGAWEAVKAAALAVAAWFAGPFAAFFVAAYQMVLGAFNSIKSAVSTAMGAVKAVITSVLNAIKAVWNAVWGTFGPLIKAIFGLIKAIITLEFYIVYGVIKTVLNLIKAVWGTVWGALKAVVSVAFGAIKAVVTAEINAVKAVITTVLNAAKAVVTTVFSAIDAVIGDKMRAAYNKVSNIVGQIKSFFAGAVGWLVSAGRDLIQGLINGIVGMGATLLNKVTDLVNSVTDKVKSVFKIGSPSKVMEELGKMVGAGLAVGISQSVDDIKKSATDLSDAFHTALDAALKAHKIGSDTAKNVRDFVADQKRQLIKLATDREAIIGRLQKARDALKAAMDLRSNAAAEVTSSATGFAALTSIERDEEAIAAARDKASQAATDEQNAIDDQASALEHLNELKADSTSTTTELAKAQKKYDDAVAATDAATALAATSKAEAAALDVPISADQLVAGMQARLDAISNYNNMLAQLAASGLNQTSYQQLVQAGVDAGTGYAQAILNGGPDAVNNVNAVQAQINTAATALGDSTASELYDAGVKSAQGLVAGLRSQRDKLTEEMTGLAKLIVKAIRKALKMKSPSRVLRDTASLAMQGFTDGIAASTGDVFKALAGLGAGVPPIAVGAMPLGLGSAQARATAGTGAGAGYVDARQFSLSAETNADPKELMDEFAWASQTTLIGRRP